MIKYKLVDQEYYTRRGKLGETKWEVGKVVKAAGEGNALCTNQVIHFYDSPEVAVLFNPIHAYIHNPRLLEIDIDKQVVHDGLKGGCKKASMLSEIKLPVFTTIQKVVFAVIIAKNRYKDKAFTAWADKWLSGEDRSYDAARAAASAAAYAAADAAADAARAAADAAADAADAAADAARAAAYAAADAARAAADAADAAADAADAAVYAASAAAYAAAYAAADAASAAVYAASAAVYAASAAMSKEFVKIAKLVLEKY